MAAVMAQDEVIAQAQPAIEVEEEQDTLLGAVHWLCAERAWWCGRADAPARLAGLSSVRQVYLQARTGD